MKKDLNRLAKECYETSKAKGFYDNQKGLDKTTKLVLILSEVGELVEAHRANKVSDLVAMPPKDRLEDVFLKKVKGTVQEELADILIRVFDFCGWQQLNLHDIVTNYHELNYKGLNNLGMMAFSEFYDYEKQTAINHIYGIYKTAIDINLKNNAGFDLLILRVLKFCYSFGINIELFVDVKMRYNKTRPYKHNKSY